MAAILLRQADQPTVPRAQPVETLDDQHLGTCESDHLSVSDGQAERGHQAHAEVLILDAVGQIHAIRQSADRGLQDMGGWRRAGWLNPLTIMEQKCGLFLCASDRNPEIPLGPDTKRRAAKILEHRSDLVVAQRFSRQHPVIPWLFALGEELQRADAVTPDPGQKAVGINTIRPDPFRHTPTDIVTVRQEVLEDSYNWLADIPLGPQGQGA